MRGISIMRMFILYFVRWLGHTPRTNIKRCLNWRDVWSYNVRSAMNWLKHCWIPRTMSTTTTPCTTICHLIMSWCTSCRTSQIKSILASTMGPWLRVTMTWRNHSTSTRLKKQSPRQCGTSGGSYQSWVTFYHYPRA